MPNNPSLRDRAAGQEVEKRDDEPQPLDVQIRQMEAQFQLAMPRGAEAKQLVRDALTAVRLTPKLAEADPKTVLGALMTCSQLGLRPGVLGHAWVLPFYDSRSRTQKAQLVIGYQGLVELAHRSGKISSLIARTVFANDEFDVAYGLEDRLHHKPKLDGDRGEPIAYYAIVKLTTGGRAFVVMTQSDAEDHRDRFAMAKTREGKIVGPWASNFEAMAHKTCVLKLAKWMPKGTDLAVAIATDEGLRIDLSPDTPPEQATSKVGPRPDDIDGEADEEPKVGQSEGPPEDPDTESTRLHQEINDAGTSLGMDEFAIAAKYASMKDGELLEEALIDDLRGYRGWLVDQVAAQAKTEEETQS